MICQLGPPTFSLTFTSAKQNWEPLTKTLHSLHKIDESKRENNERTCESNTDINTFIHKDPVTCAHYYWHRIKAIKKLIMSDVSFFGTVSDFFSVTEF